MNEATTSDARREAGDLIRLHREAAALTQKELAEALEPRFQQAARGRDRWTCTQGTITTWETGRNAPSQWKVPVIEELLGMEAGELWVTLFGSMSGRPDPESRPQDEGVAAFAGKFSKLAERDRRVVERMVDEMLGEGL